jgi:hypothetical protein
MHGRAVLEALDWLNGRDALAHGPRVPASVGQHQERGLQEARQHGQGQGAAHHDDGQRLLGFGSDASQ